MVVIFDGVNRSGKTTLIKMFSELTGFPIMSVYSRHNPESLFSIKDELKDCGAMTNDFFEDIIVTAFIDQMGADNIDVLIDRFFVSALAYRIMRDGDHGLSKKILEWWTQRVIKKGWVHLFFTVDHEVALRRENGNSETVNETDFLIVDSHMIQWHNTLNSFGARTHMVNTSDRTPSDILDEILVETHL